MPLRRSLFTVLCLAVFGMTPVVAQEKDPFAEWDRIQSRTPKNAPSALPQPKSAEGPVETGSDDSRDKSTVKYFSPAATQTEGTETRQPTPSATIQMREKSPGRSIERRTTSAVMQAGENGVLDSSGNELRPSGSPDTPATQSGQIKAVAFSPDEFNELQNGGVQNAAFTPSSESSAGSGLRTVAATGNDVGAANPFEEFLEPSPAAKQNDSQSGQFGDDASDNFAEPLLGAHAAQVAPKLPARSVAAERPLESRPASVADVESKHSDTESGPQSPGVTVEWVKHGGFNVGQECDVELIVRNTSPSMVRSVMAEAVIPPNVKVVETRPAAVEGSEMPTWTFGELQPGQSRSVMLKVIPMARGDVKLDAYVRLTGSTTSSFVVQEPMIGVAVSGPEKVEIGQQVGYIVRVSNPGTGLANNVVIQAAVPEGLEHRNGSLLNIEIGTLNPGESRQARLSLTAVQGGEQQLAVRVLADGGLSEQTVTTVVVAEPQLAIAMSGPKEPHVGRAENYTLTVSNGGNVQSTNVRAKYIVPAGFTFVSADRGGKYVEIDNAVEWFVGTLHPNDGSDFTMTMKATETGEVAHKAGVISEHGQVTTCELISKVAGTAALDMLIVADHREPKVGQEIRWEVVIRNTGTREASNVGVSCELPAGFEFIAADGPTKYIAENGVLVFRSIPVIDAASDAKIEIRGVCTREGYQRLRLRVASESVTDVLIGEETASVSK
jgi:uncharacterized repeat protein (TIGR01451 family)